MRLQLQVGLLMYHVFLNSVFHCTWLLKMLVSVLTSGGVSASELHLDFQVLQKKKKRLKSPSVKPLDLQMLTRFGVKVRVRTRVRYPLNKIL